MSISSGMTRYSWGWVVVGGGGGSVYRPGGEGRVDHVDHVCVGWAEDGAMLE